MDKKERYIKYIKHKYNIDIDKFMELFYKGKTQRELASIFHVTRKIIRGIGKNLNLDWVDRRKEKEYEYDITDDLNDLYIKNKRLQSNVKKLKNQVKLLLLKKSDIDLFDYFLQELSSRSISVPKPIRNTIITNTDWVADILVLSDWHIGEKVDFEQVSNTHNLETVESKIDKLLETVRFSKRSDKIYLLLLGDFVESGHFDELLSDESNLFDYILYTYEKFVKIINAVIDMGYKEVEIHCVSGNHSRLKQVKYYKNKFVTYESFVYAMLMKFITNSSVVKFYKNNVGYIKVNSDIIAFTHGDILKSYNASQIASFQSLFNSLYGDNFKTIIMGHFHTPYIGRNIADGYTIVNGSLKGPDEYAVFNNLGSTPAIQILLSIDKHNDYSFNLINL